MSVIALLLLQSAAAQETVQLTISDTGNTLISPDIYGQFAEHLGRSVYDGFYRDGKIRTDIAAALKKIHIPNLRWPGGCFADQYHWRDGIGDKAKRPKTVNTTWGMVTEDNSFGTDEFMELCKMIGCQPYFAGNVGTGTSQEMKEWIEYLNFDGNSAMADLRRTNGHQQPYNVSLWGVGNESWGCGGNMTPQYYADLYRHYASFCPDYPGTRLKKIASGASADDYAWTDTLMRKIPANEMYGISMHYYTLPTGNWNVKGSATNFSEAEYFNTVKSALRIEELVNKHSAIMDKYDPRKKVALLVDEWGVWTDVEPGTNASFMFQQNSLRDALVAAATLNIFNNHADRLKGANLAQTVNVIHSLILTKNDQMVLAPTYFVFDLFKVHQGAKLLHLAFNSPGYSSGGDHIPALNVSASIDSNHIVHITLVNFDPVHPVSIISELPNMHVKTVTGQVLTGQKINDINSFEKPSTLSLKNFTQAKIENGKLAISMPAKSVVMLELK